MQNNSMCLMCTWLLRASGLMSDLRLQGMRLLGSLANLAGLPGFARDCEFESKPLGARVTVRTTGLYTIVTVNGVDGYFYRLTGGIDGVGVSPKHVADLSGSRSGRRAPGQRL